MMTAPSTGPRRHVLLLGLLLAFGTSQAALVAGGDGGKYTDDKFGFSLTVAEPWKSAPLQNYSVPGVVRAAWQGPKESSIAAFVQQPGKAFSPRLLLDLSAKAMKDKLGGEIIAEEVRNIGGMKAMWLVVKGKGTGGALTGKGDTDTTQHWVAIPRTEDVVVLLLTTPAAEYKANSKGFEQALGTLKLQGKQTEEQSQAK
jgi:hypothetical protein